MHREGMKTRTPIAALAVLDLATLDRASGGCRRVVVQSEPSADGWSSLALRCGTITRSAS